MPDETKPITSAEAEQGFLQAHQFETDPQGWPGPECLVVLGVKMKQIPSTGQGDAPENIFQVLRIVDKEPLETGFSVTPANIKMVVDASVRGFHSGYFRPEVGIIPLENAAATEAERSPLDIALDKSAIVAIHLLYENWSFKDLKNGRSPIKVEGLEGSTNDVFSTFDLGGDGRTLFFICHKQNRDVHLKFWLSFDIHQLGHNDEPYVTPIDIDPKIRNG